MEFNRDICSLDLSGRPVVSDSKKEKLTSTSEAAQKAFVYQKDSPKKNASQLTVDTRLQATGAPPRGVRRHALGACKPWVVPPLNVTLLPKAAPQQRVERHAVSKATVVSKERHLPLTVKTKALTETPPPPGVVRHAVQAEHMGAKHHVALLRKKISCNVADQAALNARLNTYLALGVRIQEGIRVRREGDARMVFREGENVQ